VASIIRVADLFWFPGWGFSVSSAAKAVIMPGVLLQIGVVVPSLETAWEDEHVGVPVPEMERANPVCGIRENFAERKSGAQQPNHRLPV